MKTKHPSKSRTLMVFGSFVLISVGLLVLEFIGFFEAGSDFRAGTGATLVASVIGIFLRFMTSVPLSRARNVQEEPEE